MASTPTSGLDSDVYREFQKTQASRNKDDDEVVRLLQSLRGECAAALGPYAQVGRKATDGLEVETLPTVRKIPEVTEGRLDNEDIRKLSALYENDHQMATTLLAFANDLGPEWTGHEDLTKSMKALNRSAIPELVAELVRVSIDEALLLTLASSRDKILQFTDPDLAVLTAQTAQATQTGQFAWNADGTSASSADVLFAEFFHLCPKPNDAEVEMLSRATDINEVLVDAWCKYCYAFQ